MYLLTRCLVLDHNNCLSFDRTYNPFITWCEFEEVPNGALRHVEGTPEAFSFSEWENTSSGDPAGYCFASVSGGDAAGQGEYSIDNAVNALNENGYPAYAAAKAAGDGARCARFVQWSIEAGFGLKRDALKGKAPIPARQYGSFLEELGFRQVNTSDYLKGDIAVIQGYPGGTADIYGVPYGHVQMYNGNQWISSYYQNNFCPGSKYQKYQPSIEIYRITP